MIIDIVKAEDWEGLYVDGNLCTEGHHIESEDILECIKEIVTTCEGISDFEYVITYVSSKWMEDVCSFPTLICNIPDDAIIEF